MKTLKTLAMGAFLCFSFIACEQNEDKITESTQGGATETFQILEAVEESTTSEMMRRLPVCPSCRFRRPQARVGFCRRGGSRFRCARTGGPVVR